MKMQTLMIALALAAGGAYAQAPNASAKAPADVPAAAVPTAQRADQATKVHKKKLAQRKAAKHREQHASARQHEQHAKARYHDEQLAGAHRHDTHAMGAGASSPYTNLDAGARQHRMDQAYADWLARRR